MRNADATGTTRRVVRLAAAVVLIHDVGASSDTRPRVADTLGPTSGPHRADVNLALGNLVSVVGPQAAAYRP